VSFDNQWVSFDNLWVSGDGEACGVRKTGALCPATTGGEPQKTPGKKPIKEQKRPRSEASGVQELKRQGR
jgi:hypothetical protein